MRSKPTAKWQLQHAKARFSELVDDAVEKGPQIVTRRGVDTAVVVSSDEWQKIDYINMAKIDRALATALLMLANNPAPPKWNDENPKAAPYRHE